MTISIRVMIAGQGYRYLLNSVAVDDGGRDAASALTRYHYENGTPPWPRCDVPGGPNTAATR